MYIYLCIFFSFFRNFICTEKRRLSIVFRNGFFSFRFTSILLVKSTMYFLRLYLSEKLLFTSIAFIHEYDFLALCKNWNVLEW